MKREKNVQAIKTLRAVQKGTHSWTWASIYFAKESPLFKWFVTNHISKPTTQREREKWSVEREIHCEQSNSCQNCILRFQKPVTNLIWLQGRLTRASQKQYVQESFIQAQIPWPIPRQPAPVHLQWVSNMSIFNKIAGNTEPVGCRYLWMVLELARLDHSDFSEQKKDSTDVIQSDTAKPPTTEAHTQWDRYQHLSLW